MKTVSASAGIGAPVKIRTAEPATDTPSDEPPAATTAPTGRTVASEARRSAKRTA